MRDEERRERVRYRHMRAGGCEAPSLEQAGCIVPVGSGIYWFSAHIAAHNRRRVAGDGIGLLPIHSAALLPY